MPKQRTYLAIDLKSYYASAECAARGLDPLTTNLVVADASRTEKTICLAVSPSLKALGIPGRARLFEVVQKVREANAARLRAAIRSGAAPRKEGRYCLSEPSYDAGALAKDPTLEISYLVAPPRMAYYEKVSRQVYGIYLKYVAPEDMVVYSIDEVFIDATPYLDHYKMTAHELAKTMIREVLYTTGITATAGIGTNLYLAKLAMDITAKHAAPDKDGVRIARLDEESFRYLLWDHKPLTDFWQVGPGTVRRLEKHGIHTMGELARASIQCEEVLFQEFGVNAEILIDHAWGLEPCGMKEINAYRPESNSLCEGQVLSCPYPCEKARIVVQEMVDSMVYQLTDKGLVTDGLTLDIGYDRENCDTGRYRGPVQVDRYGRSLPKPAHGSTRLDAPSNLGSQLSEAVLNLFDQIVNPRLTVRRLTLTANRVVKDQGIFQTDFFTDTSKLEKEKSLQETMLGLKKKFGKNAILKGTNYLEGATMRDRNGRIGGHKAE
ncbi:DNA methylase [Faecalibacterium sp. An122]|uniref:Y-family DNA polymerase n=1 Tax=Faecalibacterium sp. An122 TaxID=1965551 RepID=UPI000B36A5E9|nr:DNA methylase [Faecalibacterium sp. An122]OUQ36927.1 DNA methylase [Faecalibacterium sp. An122]